MDNPSLPNPPTADSTTPVLATKVAVALRSGQAPDQGPDQVPDAFAAWAQWVNYLAECAPVEEAHRAAFTADIHIVFFPGTTLSTTILSHAQRQVRGEAMVASTGLDQILLWFYREGGVAGRFHRRAVDLPAGSLVLVDLAQPFEVLIAPSTILGLMMPRARLPAALRDRDLHGLVIGPESPTGRLLLEGLRGLERAAPDLTEAEGGLAVEGLLPLLEAAVGRAASPAAAATPAELDLLGRTQAYLEPRLTEPDLSVEDVAEGLDVSRAALGRAFESFGGVAAYVRERRLIRAHEIIASDVHPDLGLGSIAFAQGFASEAHFSRAFKQRFGIGPRAARKSAQERRRAGQTLDPPPLTPGVAPFLVKTAPASGDGGG